VHGVGQITMYIQCTMSLSQRTARPSVRIIWLPLSIASSSKSQHSSSIHHHHHHQCRVAGEGRCVAPPAATTDGTPPELHWYCSSPVESGQSIESGVYTRNTDAPYSPQPVSVLSSSELISSFAARDP